MPRVSVSADSPSCSLPPADALVLLLMLPPLVLCMLHASQEDSTCLTLDALQMTYLMMLITRSLESMSDPVFHQDDSPALETAQNMWPAMWPMCPAL